MKACPGCGCAIDERESSCAACAFPQPPAIAAAKPAWIALESLELATAIDDTERWIFDAEAKTRPARERVAAMRDELNRRLAADGAMELTHPYLIVRREPVEHKPQPLLSVLREGFEQLVAEGVLTEADLKPGLWLEQPEPIWRVNLTKLKPLARRFGKRVSDLLGRAVLRAAPTFRLTIAPNPKVLAPDASRATPTSGERSPADATATTTDPTPPAPGTPPPSSK